MLQLNKEVGELESLIEAKVSTISIFSNQMANRTWQIYREVSLFVH
jgi:hypothetical protein